MSEQAKHTPGPWGVRIEDDLEADLAGHDRAGWIHKDLLHSCGQSVAKIATWGAPFESDAEAQANARLIAAAPDLLTMLQRLLDEYLTRDPESGQVALLTLEQARQAIAKATT